MNRLVVTVLPVVGLLFSVPCLAQQTPRAGHGLTLEVRSAPSQRPKTLAESKSKKASVDGEVLVLHASNSGGGVDPDLRKLSQLKRPPFSSYDTYRLLGRHELHLNKTQFVITKLPNKRELKTSLRDILPDGRYQIVASISKKKKKKDSKGDKAFLPLLRVTARGGETFFVAGQSYKKGILVIGIRVGKAKKKSSSSPKKSK